jgi:hypothetical protein
MNWTPFKRSSVLEDYFTFFKRSPVLEVYFFFVLKGDLLIQALLYISTLSLIYNKEQDNNSEPKLIS